MKTFKGEVKAESNLLLHLDLYVKYGELSSADPDNRIWF